MKKLVWLIQKAKHSKLYLRILNATLSKIIPFNKPHGLSIKEISDESFKIFLPYKRKNLNHLRGIHACALAALSEYTAGLTLMNKIQSDHYRLIMKNLAIVFHFQAKTDVTAQLNIPDKWILDHVISPLENTESVFVDMEVDIYDTQQNHICTTTVNWQIKKWEAVKTK